MHGSNTSESRCSPGAGLLGVVGGHSRADDDRGCPSPDAAGSWLPEVIAVEGCPSDNTVSADDANIGGTTDDAETSKQNMKCNKLLMVNNTNWE